MSNQSMMQTLSLVFAFIGASSSFASDQIPGAPQKKPIVIRNATVHTVSGATIGNGSVLFVNGRITSVGANLSFPGDAEVIDAKGQHVYPGLIDSFSKIGLIEVDSLSASDDTSEIGLINPNVRAAVAFNPDSEAIPVARANGVLLAQSTPAGSLIAGRAALMMMDGWTWEGMTLKADSGMVVSWPRFSRPRTRFTREEASSTEPETDRLAPLHELMRETKAYLQARKSAPSDQPIDLRLDAMSNVISGATPLLIQANTIKQIQTAIAFTKQYDLKMILVGAADASHCLNLIKEAGVPVIVSSTYRLPSRHDAPYDEAYALPSVLQKAGIAFCIAGDGRFGASGVRNLPYQAASASAFGLTEEQAIRAITLSSAEILGVGDRVGSLDVGKDATLFIADGNILETPTQVVKAYIQGRLVDLSSKHTQLYQKYQAKYKQ